MWIWVLDFMPFVTLEPTPPPALSGIVGGYAWRAVAGGQSPSQVYHLTANGRPSLYVKVQEVGHVESLADEATRLAWLAESPVTAPLLLDCVADTGHEWLVMTEVKGTNAADATLAPDVVVAAVADGLRQMHGLTVASCPFDETLGQKLERARVNLDSGLVDPEGFDSDRIGASPQELLARLIAEQPKDEGIVVTHGDACLSNVIVGEGETRGFVDCGRIGRSDRYQDLAIACRNIASRLGASWVQPFLDNYGIKTLNSKRLEYYRLLDEFF